MQQIMHATNTDYVELQNKSIAIETKWAWEKFCRLTIQHDDSISFIKLLQ